MKQKISIITLAVVGGLGFGGVTLYDKIASNEGYTDVAVQPVPGDKCTIANGITTYADGTPVRCGDTITKKQALKELMHHVSVTEKAFVDSLPDVELSTEEYVEYVDFVFQFGIGNWRKSSIRKYLLAGDYIAACSVLPEYRSVLKKDCSKRENQCGHGQDCRGVWDRQVERYQHCMIANGVEPDPSIRKSDPCPRK